MENNTHQHSHSNDDDDFKLSSHTLAVLQEFLAEQALKQQVEESLVSENADDSFSEDWQLSQFWVPRTHSKLIMSTRTNQQM